MKKMIALLLTLLLATLPAMAEPMSVLDYTDDIAEDGAPVYYFQELALHLPADWQGKVMAMPGKGGVSFYQTASYEKYQAEGLDGGGFLFELGASKDAGFSAYPAFRYLGYSENTGMNYYLVLPTDYPAYNEDAIRAEYDAMCGQIDYVTQNVEYYPSSNITPANASDDADVPDAAGGEEPEAEHATVPLEKARYHFEHSSLPRYFYDDPANMLDVLDRVGVYRLWTSLADENGVLYPYQSSDYAQNFYTTDSGTTILQIVMPDPEATTLCYRVYMVYNPQTGKAGYYTVEFDDFLGVNCFICTWDAQGTHTMLDGAAVLDKAGDGYDAALLAEAEHVAELAGESLKIADDASGTGDDTVDVAAPDESADENLALITCPELGFTTMADPAYSWDYKEGTGISIYTASEGKIPYVIVWTSGDLIGEPFEFIREQYTPHIQSKYGDDLVGYVEYETYEIGGKQLPAGLYTYRVQGRLVDMLRIYDSTGKSTVAYTAKYLQGEGDATLAALDTAVRHYKAD